MENPLETTIDFIAINWDTFVGYVKTNEGITCECCHHTRPRTTAEAESYADSQFQILKNFKGENK